MNKNGSWETGKMLVYEVDLLFKTMLKSNTEFAVLCFNSFSIFKCQPVWHLWDLQSNFLAARFGLGKTMVVPPTAFLDFNDFFEEERLNYLYFWSTTKILHSAMFQVYVLHVPLADFSLFIYYQNLSSWPVNLPSPDIPPAEIRGLIRQ